VTSNARPRTDDHDECDTSPTLPNEKSKLFINVLGKDFHYAPLKLPLEAGMGASCIVTLDFDNDGWQDLYLCRQSDERPLLFKNQQGDGYLDVTAQHQLAGRVSDAAVIDLDLDNDPDLVTASNQAFQYQLNEGGVFSAPVDIGAVPPGGDGWAVAVGDIDGRRARCVRHDRRPKSQLQPQRRHLLPAWADVHPGSGSTRRRPRRRRGDRQTVAEWAGGTPRPERLRQVLRPERPRQWAARPVSLGQLTTSGDSATQSRQNSLPSTSCITRHDSS
jgi:hypothetical protein